MGSIRKTANGKYQGDVRDINGKRIRRCFRKKEEACAFNVKIEEEKRVHRLANLGVIRFPIGFDKIISEAICSKDALAPKSRIKYKRAFLLFGEFLEKYNIKLLSDFTRTHADSFKEILLANNLAPKTINFYLTAIKSLFNDLEKRDLIDKNPFDHVKMERLKRKNLLDREDDYYKDTEIKSFFKVKMNSSYKNAFMGLFLTGLRFEEFSTLKWERINLEKRIIQIRSDANFSTKTVSSERDIPISDKLYSILLKLKKESTSDYVFTTPQNKKLNERTLLTLCKAIASSASISKNATLHKWRHSFNSHLAQAGVDFTARQYLLGHKPQTMTDHYTKVDPTKLIDQVSRLDHLINNGPTNR